MGRLFQEPAPFAIASIACHRAVSGRMIPVTCMSMHPHPCDRTFSGLGRIYIPTTCLWVPCNCQVMIANGSSTSLCHVTNILRGKVWKGWVVYMGLDLDNFGNLKKKKIMIEIFCCFHFFHDWHFLWTLWTKYYMGITWVSTLYCNLVVWLIWIM